MSALSLRSRYLRDQATGESISAATRQTGCSSAGMRAEVQLPARPSDGRVREREKFVDSCRACYRSKRKSMPTVHEDYAGEGDAAAGAA